MSTLIQTIDWLTLDLQQIELQDWQMQRQQNPYQNELIDQGLVGLQTYYGCIGTGLCLSYLARDSLGSKWIAACQSLCRSKDRD